MEDLPSGKPYLRSVKCPPASEASATMPAVKEPPVAGVNPLKIGATITNFQVRTTKGDFDLHSFLTGNAEKPWSILFSHPKDLLSGIIIHTFGIIANLKNNSQRNVYKIHACLHI